MRLHSLLAVSALLAIIPLASADFICTYGPDGDGALTLNSDPVWNEATYTLSADMTQHWWPGHMLGTFDDGTDGGRSLLWVRNTVYNDGEIPPFDWTDYHLNITMDHPFTISGTATLPDWIVENVTQPTLQGSEWLGTVDYLGGTPIHIGDWGEFDVQLSFSGPINYCIEMIPTPEPAALLLLGLGSCLLRGRKS